MEPAIEITAERGSLQTIKQTIVPQDANERHIYIAFALILMLVGIWYLTRWDWIPPTTNSVCGAILGFLTGKVAAKLEQK